MADKRKRRGGRGRPQARRVLMQPPSVSRPGTWALDFREGWRSSVKVHPIVRLTEDGPDYGNQPGPGDEIGYGMDPYPERGDDCFTAAIATALQHPIEQVPDLRLDERIANGENRVEVNNSSWERIERWAAERGLQLTFHDTVPAERRRWIGVCPDPAPRSLFRSVMLADHCLVMSFDRLVFDPSVSVKRPVGMELRRWEPSQIAYGISFDREE